MDARLSLQEKENGQVVLAIHGIRKEPQLNYKFLRHEFTKEDKENLLKTGNMGRVVDLINPKSGETIPSIISIDRLTKEVIALRTEHIIIPEKIKGVKINEQQKQIFTEGKSLYIEDMISKKGEPFNAAVQFNADKRHVEFLFDRLDSNKQSQAKQQDVPKEFRGKELNEQQHQKLKDGQTVYVSGLLEKKGKEYQGSVAFIFFPVIIRVYDILFKNRDTHTVTSKVLFFLYQIKVIKIIKKKEKLLTISIVLSDLYLIKSSKIS